MLPSNIRNFISVFSKLPSIGPRQATRLAFYLISSGKNNLEEVSRAVAELKNMKICPRCFFVYSGEGKNLCEICSNKNRRADLVMILEKETDLISIEKTKKFNGRYLVLGEPTKNGILEAASKLRLNVLKTFIQKELMGKAEEIIIATNPTTYGDLNASLIAQELSGLAKKFTRLGRGIPTGGEIEFADEETLGSALERRM